MPPSRRNKVVALSNTSKKGKEHKTKIIEQLRKSLEEYKYVYVFSIFNSRGQQLKDVRTEWRTSRFYFGKNKVMQIALGKTEEDEYKEKLHLLSENIVGNCGLFFTNESEEKVHKFFTEFSQMEYAKSGFQSNQNVVIPQGPTKFVHSMEPYLRTKLGMPTSLKNGVVTLEREFQVCKIGDDLTPEQAQILKLLEIKMSDFHFQLVCVWSDSKFKQLRT